MARLPPSPTTYKELPAHGHNYDSVSFRILNAAWYQLETHELTDLSFPELAREAGITTGAIYPYFPNVSFLVADLIELTFKTLFRDVGRRFHPVFSTPTSQHFVRVILSDFFRFAERWPRHVALMFSKQYLKGDRFPAVAAQHREFRRLMEQVLQYELRHAPTADELHDFWAILMGCAALAAGPNRRKRKRAFALLERFFDAHRTRAASTVAPTQEPAPAH